MVAKEVRVVAERCKSGMKQLLLLPVEERKTIWRRENLMNIFGIYGKVTDPHERRAVYVKKSLVIGGGEGLFAKRAFKKGQLVSYFGGVKSFRKEFNERNRTTEEIKEAFTHLIGIGDDEDTGEELSKDNLIAVDMGKVKIIL